MNSDAVIVFSVARMPSCDLRQVSKGVPSRLPQERRGAGSEERAALLKASVGSWGPAPGWRAGLPSARTALTSHRSGSKREESDICAELP